MATKEDCVAEQTASGRAARKTGGINYWRTKRRSFL